MLKSIEAMQGAADVFHTQLAPSTSYYYSVFAHDWIMNHAPQAQIMAVPFAPGDFDFDDE